MNIPRILSSLDECDRTKFCEAIADTLYYLTEALDWLPENISEIDEIDRLWRFQGWLQGFNGSLEAWVAENPPSEDDEDDSDSDDEDDEDDSDDAENSQISIRNLIISEFGEVA